MPESIVAAMNYITHKLPDVRQKVFQYGNLCHQRGQLQRLGLPVPVELQHHIEHLESEAAASLPPDLAHAAGEMASGHRVHLDREYLANEQHQQEVALAEGTIDATGRMTKDMLGQPDGLSPDQWHAVKGGKSIEVQNDQKTQFNKPALDQMMKDQYGKNYRQMQKTLDDLADTKSISPKKYQELLAQEKGVTDEYVDQWGKGGMGIYMGLQERFADETKDEPDTVEIAPTDAEERKVQLQDTYMEHSGDVMPLDDKIDSAYTDPENDSIQGDVARAWAEVEGI